jgi:hypothetical protein
MRAPMTKLATPGAAPMPTPRMRSPGRPSPTPTAPDPRVRSPGRPSPMPKMAAGGKVRGGGAATKGLKYSCK